jgi:hypothetical protein
MTTKSFRLIRRIPKFETKSVWRQSRVKSKEPFESDSEQIQNGFRFGDRKWKEVEKWTWTTVNREKRLRQTTDHNESRFT